MHLTTTISNARRFKFLLKAQILWMVAMILVANKIDAAITPNALLTKGKTVVTSSGNNLGLTDNKFGGNTFNVGNNSWLAVNIGGGKTKVFFSWNSPAYTWSDVLASAGSCKSNMAIPLNYSITKSSNSTNGSDGQWTAVASVTGNAVSARGHVVDFSGASWIRMNISSGGGSFDEIEVFDLSNNGTDLWFFPGTSITANTYKGTPPSKTYSDLINQVSPDYRPAMIRGGIPCISSSNMVADLSKYLNYADNVKYWAIEMGTNDAWGGSNANVTLFKKNLQSIITACKNVGIQPVIARMIATNKSAANWQVHPDYLKAIDDLTVQNNLIAGPDLYTWFSTHPGDLGSDGIHPNTSGAASIQRLWSEKMGPLYQGCAATALSPSLQVDGADWQAISSAKVMAGSKVILGPQPVTGGTWSWSGCGTSGSSREQTIMSASSCTATATYTNDCGQKSTIAFDISINGTTCCGSTTSAGFAYCCTNSDPDGDGWGWENNASCIIPQSSADPDKCGFITGIQERHHLLHATAVYPSPCKDLLKTGLPFRNIPAFITYDIYNTTGELVGRETVRPEGSVVTIKTSHLQEAMYVLKIATDEGHISRMFTKLNE